MQPVALEADGARMWIPRLFPGIAMAPRDGFRSARLAVAGMGAGRALVVESVADRVERRIGATADATSAFVKILLQARGESNLETGGRRFSLRPRDVAVLDGADAFRLEFGADYRQVLFQVPRALVEGRAEGLLRGGARVLDGHEPVTAMLFSSLEAIVAELGRLSGTERSHLLSAVVGLLGVLRGDGRSEVAAERRFSRALADIDTHLPDPELSPRMLADLQRISRRRLDAIFAERGVSPERIIWERRLRAAAADLGDRQKRKQRLLELALSWGFKSDAHFSRAFRRKYGESPRAYRRRAGGS